VERPRRDRARERRIGERWRRDDEAAQIDVIGARALAHVRARDEHGVGGRNAAREIEPPLEPAGRRRTRPVHAAVHERVERADRAGRRVAVPAELRKHAVAVGAKGAMVVDAHDPARGFVADGIEHGGIEDAGRDRDRAAGGAQDRAHAFGRGAIRDAVVATPADLGHITTVTPRIGDLARDHAHVDARFA